MLTLSAAAVALVACSAGHAQQAHPSPTVVQTNVETLTAAGLTLGVVVDQNMRVVDVDAGSAAQHIGIQRNDVIESIQGTPLTSAESARTIVGQAKAGQRLAVTIQRGNQRITLNAVMAPAVGHPGQATPTPVPPSQEYF